MDTPEKPAICYHKLVRDKIPSIIRQDNKKTFIKSVTGNELSHALSHKLLEEAYELFTEMHDGDPESLLQESADVLEVLLTILRQNDQGLDELVEELKRRREEKGGFEKGYLLESVHEECQGNLCRDCPGFEFTHLDADSLLNLFKGELERSDKAWIASAFYSPAITNVMTHEFERFMQRGGDAKIILSTMGGLIKPEYLAHLRDFVPGLQLKVFHPPALPFEYQPKEDFHVKSYIFRHRTGKGAVVIGSSNLSQAGFSENIEWNYYSAGEINLPFENGKSPWERIVGEFEDIWDESCVKVTDDFLAGYRQRHVEHSQAKTENGSPRYPQDHSVLISGAEAFSDYGRQNKAMQTGIEPNSAQVEALEGLDELRNRKARSGAVIAATGVGKTYLAAFDFLKSGKDKVLFIAHRGNILKKARESFAHVLGPVELEIFSGQKRQITYGAKGVFAMIQTLGRKQNLEKFHPREFDYVVVDEFHHAMAKTYRKVIEYFQPDFLLGLTATPERMDGRDVLQFCDYNIAYELRLFQAIDKGLLAPFQYFAVHDPTDYSQIAWRRTDYDPEELGQALANDTRTALIANNLKKFLPYKGKIKALAFCSSVDHACYTAHQLSTKHDIAAIDLVGDSSDDDRSLAISRLEDEHDPLNVICCVDIFNEGIDIPKLSHVLLLRPTQSFTVFLQQLGRGLRKIQDEGNPKSLVVIDFVGNFKKAHVAPLALGGYASIQEYMQDVKTRKRHKSFINESPKGCFVSPDIEVQRIWDSKLKAMSPMPIKEQLKALYDEIVQDLESVSPGLSEFYSDPQKADPRAFIKHFGSWLKTKKAFDDLSEAEKGILGTPGEYFLEHLEKDLNPVKSYKMVVLKTIIGFEGTHWKVQDIARGFLDYYLDHPEHMQDYEDLARQETPAHFPVSRIVTHIMNMPLNFLSNKPKDWFILDREKKIFSVKPDLIPYWKADFYKAMVLDRADYALARYFYRKTRQTQIYADKGSFFDRRLPLDRTFVRAALNDNVPAIGQAVDIQVRIDGQKYRARLERPEEARDFILNYKENEELSCALERIASTGSRKTKKMMRAAYAGKNIFELRSSA